MTVRDWLLGGESRLLFLPFLHKFAARLEQVEIRQMLTDPGVMTRCLRDAQRLFGYDGVINNFDTTLEAEACGCQVDWANESPEIALHVVRSKGLDGLDANFLNQGRVPVVLETTKRLRREVFGSISLIAGVTGPLTLAAQLAGDSFSDELAENSMLAQDLVEFSTDVCVSISRKYCDLGVDGILVIEDFLAPIAGLASVASELQSPLRTLRNVTQYYSVPLVLAAKGSYDLAELQRLSGLAIDALSTGNVISPLRATRGGADAVRVCGLSVPSSTFTASGDGEMELVGELIRMAEPLRCFLTSEWEVPLNTVPQQLHKIAKLVAEYRERQWR